MITLEKEIVFWSNDFWRCNKVKLHFTEPTIALVDKARKLMFEHKDEFEKICLRFEDFDLVLDEGYDSDDFRIDVSLLYIYGDDMYFYAQNKWDSGDQFESDHINVTEIGLDSLY